MDLHQQSKSPTDVPITTGARGGTFGLDHVYNFFNDIFSSGTFSQCTAAQDSLHAPQQGIPPPAHGASSSRPESLRSLGSPLFAEVERSHSRERIDSVREHLPPSGHRGYGITQGNEVGSSQQEEPSSPHWRTDRRGQPYEACLDDLLDQHVAYYLWSHPETHSRHSIYRVRPGVYLLNRREVQVEWDHAEDARGEGFLVIVDGVLRQPFADYMEMTDTNAEYDTKNCGRNSLHNIPREQRLSFHDQHKVYTRLEAMKVATEQAAFREKHADYLIEGMEVPDDLMMKYKTTVQQKLGWHAPHKNYDGSKSLREDITPSQHVVTRPPAHVSTQQQVLQGYTHQNVFASEPMDYFATPVANNGGSSIWGTICSSNPHRL